MKAPTGPKDSNGRTILEGDRVDSPAGSRIVLQPLASPHSDIVITNERHFEFRAYLLTITHRGGRPIDEVSPLLYDEHGRLFEVGCLVGKLEERDTDTRRQDRRVLAFRGGRIITSAWGYGYPSELRIIPDEPEVREVTLTLLVEDGADLDAISLPDGVRRKGDA